MSVTLQEEAMSWKKKVDGTLKGKSSKEEDDNGWEHYRGGGSPGFPWTHTLHKQMPQACRNWERSLKVKVGTWGQHRGTVSHASALNTHIARWSACLSPGCFVSSQLSCWSSWAPAIHVTDSWNSCLLRSAWPGPACCYCWGSDQVVGRFFLCFTFSLCHTNKHLSMFKYNVTLIK